MQVEKTKKSEGRSGSVDSGEVHVALWGNVHRWHGGESLEMIPIMSQDVHEMF